MGGHIPIFPLTIMSSAEISPNHIAKTSVQLALLCLVSRIAFKLISGYDNFQLFGDSVRYDNMSNDILAGDANMDIVACLLYTSPSPRDATLSRMPSSA